MEKNKKFNFTKILAPIVLVLLYLFFSIFGRNFFSDDYLINILDGSYYIGFMAKSPCYYHRRNRPSLERQ